MLLEMYVFIFFLINRDMQFELLNPFKNVVTEQG